MKKLALARTLRSGDLDKAVSCMEELDDSAVVRAVRNNAELLDGQTAKTALEHLSPYRAYTLRLGLVRANQTSLLYDAHQRGYVSEDVFPNALAKLANASDETNPPDGQFVKLISDWVEGAQRVQGWSEYGEELATLVRAFPGRVESIMGKLVETARADRSVAVVRPVLFEVAARAPRSGVFACIDELGWPDRSELPYERLKYSETFQTKVRLGAGLFEHAPYKDGPLADQLLERSFIEHVHGAVQFEGLDPSAVTVDEATIVETLKALQRRYTEDLSKLPGVLAVVRAFPNAPDLDELEPDGLFDQPVSASFCRQFFEQNKPGRQTLVRAAESAHEHPAAFAVTIERSDWSSETLTEAAVCFMETTLKDADKLTGEQTVEPLLQLLDAGLSSDVQQQLLMMIPLKGESPPESYAEQYLPDIQQYVDRLDYSDPHAAALCGEALLDADAELDEKRTKALYDHVIETLSRVGGPGLFAKALARRGYLPQPEQLQSENGQRLVEMIKEALNRRQRNFLGVAS